MTQYIDKSAVVAEIERRISVYQWKYSGSNKEIVDVRTWIIQITKEGKQICTYESVTKASTSTGISRTSISNNLSNKSKSAGGFVWKKLIENS